MNILSKNTFIALSLVVLVVFGMWWGLPDSSSEQLTTEVVGTGPDGNVVNALITLRTVTLTGTIFSDPSFISLKDLGVDIVPEPAGRRNPFAPLMSNVQAVAPTTPSQAVSPVPKEQPKGAR